MEPAATVSSPVPIASRGPIAALPSPSIPTGNKGARLWELDFTKGFLILVMVLYHWWSLFVSPFGHFFNYVRFLTPSFICISGFIVASVYFSKYGVSRGAMARRLVVRGLKLLGVFLGLNLARAAVSKLWLHLPLGRWDAHTMLGVWVTGDHIGGGADKVAAFHILVPIGYLLLALAPLVLARHMGRRPIAIALAASWIAVVALWFAGSLYSYTLELVAIGLLGGVLGAIPIPAIERFIAHWWAAIAIAYVGYVAAVHAWGVPYIIQVVGVPLSLLLIFAIGRLIRSFRFGDPIAFFGRYSLLGYIVQIAILQVMGHLWGRASFGLLGLGATLLAAAILTYVGVVIADRLRSASPLADRVYRAVFA